MQNLDRTGTYLKYFGRKQDTVYIKNLLISIKLRWKKLVRRADEKGRLLQQAYKEDKRVLCFYYVLIAKGNHHGFLSGTSARLLCGTIDNQVVGHERRPCWVYRVWIIIKE